MPGIVATIETGSHYAGGGALGWLTEPTIHRHRAVPSSFCDWKVPDAKCDESSGYCRVHNAICVHNPEKQGHEEDGCICRHTDCYHGALKACVGKTCQAPITAMQGIRSAQAKKVKLPGKSAYHEAIKKAMDAQGEYDKVRDEANTASNRAYHSPSQSFGGMEGLVSDKPLDEPPPESDAMDSASAEHDSGGAGEPLDPEIAGVLSDLVLKIRHAQRLMSRVSAGLGWDESMWETDDPLLTDQENLHLNLKRMQHEVESVLKHNDKVAVAAEQGKCSAMHNPYSEFGPPMYNPYAGPYGFPADGDVIFGGTGRALRNHREVPPVGPRTQRHDDLTVTEEDCEMIEDDAERAECMKSLDQDPDLYGFDGDPAIVVSLLASSSWQEVRARLRQRLRPRPPATVASKASRGRRRHEGLDSFL